MTPDKANALREAAERVNVADIHALNDFLSRLDPPTILDLLAERERLRGALEWYAEQVRDCRKVTSEGNDARRNLDRDGGDRARRALTEGAA